MDAPGAGAKGREHHRPELVREAFPGEGTLTPCAEKGGATWDGGRGLRFGGRPPRSSPFCVALDKVTFLSPGSVTCQVGRTALFKGHFKD